MADAVKTFLNDFGDVVKIVTDVMADPAFWDAFAEKGAEIFAPLLDPLNSIGHWLGQNLPTPYDIDQLTNNLFNSAAKFIQPIRRDPLTLDLDGDGLETVGTSAGILFDHDADGVKTGTGWVKSDDGFLVLDKNGNGIIDNGRELFGDAFIKSNGQTAVDGFDALRDLDSNGNGKIDSGDAQFNNLKVWRDLNQDGITQSGELFTLSQLGIASINVTSTEHSQTLANGNQVADLGTYTKTDGSTGITAEISGSLADINLATDTFHRQFTAPLDTTDVAHLPDMQGSGAVRDLREAASQSPALAATLNQLGADTTRAELQAAVAVLLQQWADSAVFTDSFEAAAVQNKDLFFVPPGVSVLDAYNAHYQGLWGTYYASTSGGTAGSAPLTTAQITNYEAIRAQQAHIERLLKTLEAFNGRHFTPIADSTGNSTLTSFAVATPGGTGGTGGGFGSIAQPVLYSMEQGRYDLLTQSYQQLVDSVYGALVTQTRLKPYLDAISLNIDTQGISLDFTGMDALLNAKRQTHIGQAYTDLLELYKYTGNQLNAGGWEGVTTLRAWIEQAVGHADLQPILAEFGVKIAAGTLTGTANDDLLFGQTGNDVIKGEAGNDLIDGGAGSDTLYGGAGNDLLLGGAGNDTLYGEAGDDTLDGGAGNDYLSGGAGSDTYRFGRGGGQDTLYNYDTTAGKTDVLQFAADLTPADIVLTRNSDDLVLTIAGTNDKITVQSYFYDDATGPYRLEEIRFADGTVWTPDTVKTLAITGNDSAQTLRGYATADVIEAGGGNDTVYGNGGNDLLDGGAGNDILYGGAGNDLLLGGAGNDTLYGEAGDDTLDGGAGNDYLSGGAGSDTYRFGRGGGQDTLYNYDTTAGKTDVLQFAADLTPADIVFTRNSDDLVLTIAGTSDKITVQSYFNNEATGPYRLEEIRFADGTVWTPDTVKTLAITGNDSAQLLRGYATDDVIEAGGGNDTVYGGAGNDLLRGGDGNNSLYGEAGNDALDGGAGNDTLNGGEGSDILSGGLGKDTYVLMLRAIP